MKQLLFILTLLISVSTQAKIIKLNCVSDFMSINNQDGVKQIKHEISSSFLINLSEFKITAVAKAPLSAINQTSSESSEHLKAREGANTKDSDKEQCKRCRERRRLQPSSSISLRTGSRSSTWGATR